MSLTYLYNKLEKMNTREQYCYIQNILLLHQIRPKFDINKKLYVFSSHSHHDHYNKCIFDLEKIHPNVVYILSNDIKQSILNSFIPSLNQNIIEISDVLNMQFIPVFDLGFNCSIHRGEMQIPVSSLSTGQLKLVDMVIILAVLNSIMARVNTNIIFLDELFSNLDGATRTELIGVLRYILPKNSSILVVSHQDIDNNLFDGQLRMELKESENNQKQTNIIYT